MGFDRPSGDHANAKVIFLLSAHLEAGHYFNPHAQRIIEGKTRGAKVICVDPRLSNTASMSDHWVAVWPGTEAVLLLAIARLLLQDGTWDREFVRRWVNWEHFLRETRPDLEPSFANLAPALIEHYAEFTPEYAANVCGIPAGQVRQLAAVVATAVPGRLSSHTWRAAAAGNEGGWQVARCLWFLNVLTGSVGTEGGASPNGWNKFIPVPPQAAHPHGRWNPLTWPAEYPLAHHEMSFLLPHFLREGRGRIDTYFSRVYNPVWTNPDGFAWLEVLTDESLVGCHVALTPTWSESAWFADYVLPMGNGAERHDLASYETHAGRWIGFRQPVLRVDAEREGRPVSRTWEANPGEVWEEQEFWIDLSWHIDPDGSLGDPPALRVDRAPRPAARHRRVLRPSVPPFDPRTPGGARRPRGAHRWSTCARTARSPSPATSWRYTRRRCPPRSWPRVGERRDGEGVHRVPGTAGLHGSLDEIQGHMPFIGDGSLGVDVDGEVRTGFPTPSRKLELYSDVMRDWGWPEHALPGFIKSHVHWEDLDFDGGERILIPTFRIPTLIHTRSGQAKWLAEISHAHPMWIHPSDAERLGIAVDGLVRITTRIGHFVIRAWRTEGIRPGVVGVSHHMGRWRLDDDAGTPRYVSGLTSIDGPVAATARGPRPRERRGVDDAPRRRRPPVRVDRPRQRAGVVERPRRAPEPDVPRPAGPDFRHALLAAAGHRRAGRAGRPLRRRRRRHRALAPGVPRVAGQGPPGPRSRRVAPPPVVRPARQAAGDGLPHLSAPARRALVEDLGAFLRDSWKFLHPEQPVGRIAPRWTGSREVGRGGNVGTFVQGIPAVAPEGGVR